MDHQTDRRAALRALAGAGAAGLAGCADHLPDTETPTRTSPTPTPTPDLSFDVGPSTFRYGSARRAYDPDAMAPTAPLRTVWETRLAHQYTHPVVVDGTVFLSGRFAGLEEPNLLAYDVTTGGRQWGVELTALPGPVSVDDDTVFTQSSGGVHALDAATGDERYALRTPKPVGRLPGALDGGVVIATSDDVGGEDPEYLSLVAGR